MSLTVALYAGNWIIEDDGIAGNNQSRVRNLDNGAIITFVHPSDSMTVQAQEAGVNLTIDLTDSLGGASFAVGDLTDPGVTPDSVVIRSVETTGRVTLVSNGIIGEDGGDAAADIIAGELVLSAVAGIGTGANAIETQTGQIEAETIMGGIQLANAGNVVIGALTGEVAGLHILDSGNVSLINLGSILIDEADPGSFAATIRSGPQGGDVTLIAAGAGSDIVAIRNVDPVFVNSGNVVLGGGRDIVLGQQGFGNDVLASGSVTITAGRDVLIAGRSVLLGSEGGVSLAAGRNATVIDVAGLATDLGDIFLAAGSGGTLTMTSAFGLWAGNGGILLRGDRMVLATAGNQIVAEQGTVTIEPVTLGRRIDLGSASDAAAALELSDAELDTIVAHGGLVIGSYRAGGLSLSSAIDLLFVTGVPADVTLRSGGNIDFGTDFATTGTLAVSALGDISQANGTITAATATMTVDAVDDDDPGIGGTAIFEIVNAAAITVTGGADEDRLAGPHQTASLLGFGGNDVLWGQFGDDTLDGGTGADHMEGRSGDDTYAVDSAADVVVERAGDGSDRVLATAGYALAFGAEVELLAAANRAATTALALAGNDFDQDIVGNEGVNGLQGLAGSDTLFGNGGHDTLDGGTGDDVAYGGLGDDIFHVDAFGDVVAENAGQGRDRVLAAASYALASGSEVELLSAANQSATTALDLVGNDLPQTIFGNEGVNQLEGNGGIDTLWGLGGNDVLDGGAGGDRAVGGTGDDRFAVDEAADLVVEAAGEGADRVLASISYALSAGAEVELLSAADQASVAPLDLAGNAFANNIQANEGANILHGGDDDDSLFGLGGSDTLNGGAGSDRLTGGAGRDIHVFADALGPTNVDLVMGFVSGDDRFHLDDSVFAALAPGALPADAFRLGARARDADDRILYDQATGRLLYDADGSGSAADPVPFATLRFAPPVAAADFIVI